MASSLAIVDSANIECSHTALIESVHVPGELDAVVTTTVCLQDGVMFLSLDGLPVIPLLPSPESVGVWEGYFADVENQLLPGVTVEIAPIGNGVWSTIVTVGWTDPVRVGFEFLDETSSLDHTSTLKCECEDPKIICLPKNCLRKDLCTGDTEKKCRYVVKAGIGEVFTGWSGFDVDVVNDMLGL